MTSNLILVFTSPDRPGVIETLTSAVVELGGNWEESRLARMWGDFAGIARVTVEADQVETLIARLHDLSAEGISVHARPAAAATPTQPSRTAELACAGADHEGIVNRLTAFLARRGINVEEMETDVEPAPTTGTPVFRMLSRISLPHDLEEASLKEQLRELANRLAVDLTWNAEPV